jgi:hypothetical protein
MVRKQDALMMTSRQSQRRCGAIDARRDGAGELQGQCHSAHPGEVAGNRALERWSAEGSENLVASRCALSTAALVVGETIQRLGYRRIRY